MLSTILKINLWGIAISLAVGLSCLINAACGVSWWKSPLYNMEQGLISIRVGGFTRERKNIFHFQSYNLDNILILIIVSCIFATLSLLCLLVMCFFKEKKSTWTIGTGFLICLTFLSGAISIAAVYYAEIYLHSTWKKYEHGGSAICAWVGAGLCSIAWILACSSCMSGRPGKNKKYIINEKK